MDSKLLNLSESVSLNVKWALNTYLRWFVQDSAQDIALILTK